MISSIRVGGISWQSRIFCFSFVIREHTTNSVSVKRVQKKNAKVETTVTKMIVLVGSTLLLFLYVVVFPIRAGLSGYNLDAEDEEFG